jgi:3-dehydroquinate dehydratase-2
MASLLLINGPNLNLLGSREPELYGRASLSDIEQKLCGKAESLGHSLVCFQSNSEEKIIDRIQKAAVDRVNFLLLNPGAFGHTSIAIRDALLGTGVPFIEVHLSNIFAREDFRRHSYLSDIAAGCLFGLGASGYELALLAAHAKLTNGT